MLDLLSMLTIYGQKVLTVVKKRHILAYKLFDIFLVNRIQDGIGYGHLFSNHLTMFGFHNNLHETKLVIDKIHYRNNS